MHRRTTARVTGILFLTATAAGALGAGLLGSLDTLDSARAVADRSPTLAAGALLILLMAVAIAMIPPTLHPVLKEHGEAQALGYVVARTIEVVLVLPAAVGPLALVAASSREPGAVDPVLALTRTYDLWGPTCSSVFFCLSVVLLNHRLHRSRLVPRWIAVWALAAVLPYLADALLAALGPSALPPAVRAVLVVPLALNEMALALRLLVRGFTAPAPEQSARAAAAVPDGRPVDAAS
ncbi:DUF4386 domain-containing protein [Kitasatospora sp. NPDC051914]|uniref:DUF4386 domain-containing protein n=1 Tax=Kitasatospora sp. NPDC051914 TaxID=3154945 RepID=UPI00341861EB